VARARAGSDFLAPNADKELSDFLDRVRVRIGSRLDGLSALTSLAEARDLLGGKMLRSRLAGRLMLSGAGAADAGLVERAAAAVELVHTASLCHDDVIDNALLRRATPTLWRRTSSSGAVLVGDILLCEAMTLLLETENNSLLVAFMGKVTQVCLTEARQELVYRGRQIDEETCLALAFGKTGALFAFAAEACARMGSDEAAAFGQAGYCLGTAYQLADDLLDVVGNEKQAGKTLGTDGKRNKFTLPQVEPDGAELSIRHVRRLCSEAAQVVDAWPMARQAVEDFLARDFGPVLEMIGQPLDKQAKSSV
jgi:geranylgeranyl pyrophosphate synthase